MEPKHILGQLMGYAPRGTRSVGCPKLHWRINFFNSEMEQTEKSKPIMLQKHY
jgi:hypothetical protein